MTLLAVHTHTSLPPRHSVSRMHVIHHRMNGCQSVIHVAHVIWGTGSAQHFWATLEKATPWHYFKDIMQDGTLRNLLYSLLEKLYQWDCQKNL